MKIYIIVHGIVQGVGYRAYVKEQAERQSIRGYVRNMDDGSVEVFAIGNEEPLAKFIDALHVNVEHGPDVFYVEKHRQGENGFIDKGNPRTFSVL